MKIKGVKVFIFTAIAFVFVSLLSFSPNNFLNSESKVCASGYSCVKNYGNCASLSDSNGRPLESLQESLENGQIQYVGFNSKNKSDFQTQLTALYTGQPLCLNKDISYVIKYSEGSLNPISDQDGALNLFNQGGIYDTPRLCPVGTIGSSFSIPTMGNSRNVAGCCPVGSSLVPTVSVTVSSDVTVANQVIPDGDNTGSYVACCPSRFNYYATSVSVAQGNSYFGETPTQGSCISYDNNLKTVTDFDTDVANLQTGVKGLTLAQTTIQNNGNPLVIGERIGADLSCPSDSSCTLVSPNNPNNSTGNCTDPFDATSCIMSKDYLTTSGQELGFSCQSCFSAGQAVGVVTAENNPKKGNVAICQSNGTVLYVEGVNGSITDTEACLKSEGGYQSENYNYCKQCRESGGTWSGLGCIDSTPTGLITWIMRIAYGVMGGVALIQFIIAGIYYQTGQEEKVKEARKNIIATITGLAVLTFSILILRVIGINILDILPTGSF